MEKCYCYDEEKRLACRTPMMEPIYKTVTRCNGTRERDECSCGGDETKCDFYPEVREKALKKQEPKFGDWISVNDRLPTEDVRVLVYVNTDRSYTNIDTDRMLYGKWVRWYADVTHWMHLPKPPKGE